MKRRVAAALTAAPLVLAFAGDRGARLWVTHRVADRARCALAADSASAHLRAATTAPQLVSGRLGDVDLTASGVQRQGLSLGLTASLHDVRTDGHVGATTATVVAPWDQVADRGLLASGAGGGSGGSGSGAPLPGGLGALAGGEAAGPQLRGDGQQLLITTELGGLGVPVTVTADLSADERTPGGALRITPTALQVLGRSLPVDEVRAALAARAPQAAAPLAGRTVPLHLPSGARLTAVTPRPDGLALQVDRDGAAPAGGGAPRCG